MGGPILQQEVGADAGVKNILLATQTENFDEALDGFDLTASAKISAINTEVGAGVYYLSAGGGPDTWGVTGSAETWVTPNLAANVNVSHDDFFDTTVYGGVSLYFGGPAIDVRSRSTSVASRLWSRVQRRDVVPVYNYTLAAPDLLATNTVDGDVIAVVCIDNTATGQDLIDAPGLMEADGDLVDIIIAGTEGVDAAFDLNGLGGIELNEGQRLLGANKAAMVEIAEMGGMTIALPGTSLDAGFSTTITGDMDTDIVTLLGDGVEVSGLSLATTGTGNAVAGGAVTNFDINCNVVTGGGGIDLGMTGVDISGVIEDNMITGALNNGIDLDGQNIDVDLTGNTVVMSMGDNVNIEADADFSGDVMGNTLNLAAGNGLSITAETISGDIIDNIANQNDLSGIFVEVDSVAMGEVLDIVENTTNLNGILAFSGADGIELIFNGDSDSEVFIDDNTADGNDGDGLDIETFGLGDLLGQVSNNTFNGNFDDGIDVETDLVDSDVLVDFIMNTASGNLGAGIEIDTTGDFIGALQGNIANFKDDDGISLVASGDIMSDITGNMLLDNDSDGLQADATNISGTVSDNVASDNDEAGLYFEASEDIDLVVTGNVTNNNDNNGSFEDAGITLIADNDVNGMVDGNTANGNAQAGIFIQADVFDMDGNGDVNATVSNNTVGIDGNGNGTDGLFIGGQNITGDVTGNIADDNVDAGISINALSDIGATGTPVQITGNMIGQVAGNGGVGLELTADRDIFANINNNMVAFSESDNIAIRADNNFNGSLIGNTSNDSVFGSGIFLNVLNDVGSSGMGNEVLIQSNTTSRNELLGLFVNNTGNLFTTLDQNTADENGLDGITVVTTGNLTGDVTGNFARVNQRRGFSFSVSGVFDGDFTGNTGIANNVSAGGFDDFSTGAGSIIGGSIVGPNTGGTFGNATLNPIQIAFPTP